MAEADLKSILTHWGAFEIVRPFEGGHRNAAFLVHGPSGDFVLKSTRRSEASIDWLVDVFQIARAQNIVVPTLQKGKNGLYVQNGWTLELFLHGAHPEELPLEWLRWVMPKFHAQTCNFVQRPTFISSSDLIGVEVGGDIDLRHMPQELVHAVRAAWASVKASPTSVVHGDINVSNIIAMPDGNFALLDWDEARVDCRLFDEVQFASALPNRNCIRAAQAFEIACCWHVEPKYAQGLARAFLTQ